MIYYIWCTSLQDTSSPVNQQNTTTFQGRLTFNPSSLNKIPQKPPRGMGPGKRAPAGPQPPPLTSRSGECVAFISTRMSRTRLHPSPIRDFICARGPKNKPYPLDMWNRVLYESNPYIRGLFPGMPQTPQKKVLGFLKKGRGCMSNYPKPTIPKCRGGKNIPKV